MKSKTSVTIRSKGIPNYGPDDVATRAYFIHQECGGSPEENWAQAEAEFQAGLWTF